MHYDYLLGYVGPEEVLCTEPSDHDPIVVSQPATISNNPGIILHDSEVSTIH